MKKPAKIVKIKRAVPRDQKARSCRLASRGTESGMIEIAPSAYAVVCDINVSLLLLSMSIFPLPRRRFEAYRYLHYCQCGDKPR